MCKRNLSSDNEYNDSVFLWGARKNFVVQHV